MRIYSRTGDGGTTGLIGGGRVSKTDARIEAVGHLDELNAALGVSRTHPAPELISNALGRLQNLLFDAGAEVAAPPGSSWARPNIAADHIERLEREIDVMTGELPPLKNFILPGGAPLAAALHMARTICRRAERAVLRLHELEPVRDELIQFLNRLSDWLFTAARFANQHAAHQDVIWTQEAP